VFWQVLVSTLRWGDIVIMDNLRAHEVASVEAVVKATPAPP
jgi:hypothetical protein